MRRQVRRRFWIEAGMAAASAFLLVLTILWSDWIEFVFRFDPDHNNGSFERLIVTASITSTIIFICVANRELRKSVARA